MVKIKVFFDKVTFTLSYLVYDEKSSDALIIDPVLDYNPNTGKISKSSIEAILTFINDQKLKLRASLETHAHADHITGAKALKELIPNLSIVIGENIKEVQTTFKAFFNLDDLKTDGSQFDKLVKDNEEFYVGTIKIKAINTPGHTPACISYLIDDALFTGDALFMPDFGTGRCDFPKGSAEVLFNSIKHKIFSLPDSTRIFVGHDYQPNGRVLEFESTVKDQKEKNIHISNLTTKDHFIEFRNNRDKTLDAPRLLLPSIQVNIRGGEFPKPESNGVSYLKLPIR
ncbi:MAG: MBL fold metallo-hydrolase [Bacteriovoracaceae bacterium]